MKRQHGRLQHMRAAAAQSRPTVPVSGGHVEKPDLLCMRPVERTNRLGGGLQQNLAAIFCEKSFGFRRERHIAHLARAENELLASPLEDEPRFLFREHMRGTIIL